MELGFQASRVERVQVSSDGSALLLTVDGHHAWADLSKPPQLHFVPCAGPAHLRSDGDAVTCTALGSDQTAIYTMRPKRSVAFLAVRGVPYFQGKSSILHRQKGKLVSTETSGSSSKRLTTFEPSGTLLVSPDGKRAIGVFPEDTIEIVATFSLTKKSARRTLMQAADALAFSADSSWLALQQERDACAVRAVGGQYKCWRHYRAIDVSSHGFSLLMRKSSDDDAALYIGEVAGPEARKPRRILDGTSGAAAFWPKGDQSAPLNDTTGGRPEALRDSDEKKESEEDEERD
jgi:hypothetical protein